MIHVTPAAVFKLKALILEHPDDPVVRIGLKDMDEHRLVFTITLENRIEADDVVQDCNGLTVAVSAEGAARMDGVTLDHREPDGFTFQHPQQEEEDELFGRPDLN